MAIEKPWWDLVGGEGTHVKYPLWLLKECLANHSRRKALGWISCDLAMIAECGDFQMANAAIDYFRLEELGFKKKPMW